MYHSDEGVKNVQWKLYLVKRPPWIRPASPHRFHLSCSCTRRRFAIEQARGRGTLFSLHWRHNDHYGVSNHQPHGCLLNRLFRRRSKKTSKFRVTGLCVGNSPGPVNSPPKGPVTRKMFPFDDVIMWLSRATSLKRRCLHLNGIFITDCTRSFRATSNVNFVKM